MAATNKPMDHVVFSSVFAFAPAVLVAIACVERFNERTDLYEQMLLGLAAALFTVFVGVQMMRLQNDRKALVRRSFGIVAGIVLAVGMWMAMISVGRDETAGMMNATFEGPANIGNKTKLLLKNDGFPIEFSANSTTVNAKLYDDWSRTSDYAKHPVYGPIVRNFNTDCLKNNLAPSFMDINVSGDNTVNALVVVALVLAAIGTVTFDDYRAPKTGKLVFLQGTVSLLLVVLGFVMFGYLVSNTFPRYPDEIKVSGFDSAYEHRENFMNAFGAFIVLVLVHDAVSAAVRVSYNSTLSEGILSTLYEVGSWIMAIVVATGSFLMAGQLKYDGVGEEFVPFLNSFKSSEVRGFNSTVIKMFTEGVDTPPAVSACLDDEYTKYKAYAGAMTLVVPLAVFYVWRSVYAHEYYERE